jgi:hyaluronoglucosaminidase
VIDFESWRPTFRQNFGSLQPYKDVSYSDAREKQPLMPEKRLQVVAASQFEKFGKLFMEETIKLAKQLRPNAKWGYYGFPYCFNGNANNIENCGEGVKEETDK